MTRYCVSRSMLIACFLFLAGLPASAQDYTELEWGYLFTGHPTENWECNLPSDVGPDRCYIDPELANRAKKYIFNGALSVHVPDSACDGVPAAEADYCGYIYHYAQFNNGSGDPQADPPILPTGPASHQGSLGGDEWLVFRCPEHDPFCADEPIDVQDQSTRGLVLDHVRPNNLCKTEDGCAVYSWQLKSAFFNPRVGTSGKVDLFAKASMKVGELNLEPIIQENRFYFNRHQDPSNFPADIDVPGGPKNGWELAFYNRQDRRLCNAPIIDPLGGPEFCPSLVAEPEHAYRLIDLALIPDPVSYRLDLAELVAERPSGKTNGYVGYLSWIKDNDDALGCNCCEVKQTTSGCEPDTTPGGTFVVIEPRIGTWFADPAQPPSSWKFVEWGGALQEEITTISGDQHFIPLALPRTTWHRRTFNVHRTQLADGSYRYEGWQSKASETAGMSPCPPSPDTSVFDANRNAAMGQEKLVYFTFNPENGRNLNDDVENIDRAGLLFEPQWIRKWLPSQYNGALTWMMDRFDFEDPQTGVARQFLTAGTRDNVICDLNFTGNASRDNGRGVWWSELTTRADRSFRADDGVDASSSWWKTVTNSVTQNRLSTTPVWAGFPGHGSALRVDIVDPAIIASAPAYADTGSLAPGGSSAVRGGFLFDPQTLTIERGKSLAFAGLHVPGGAPRLIFFLQRSPAGSATDSWRINVWYFDADAVQWKQAAVADFAAYGAGGDDENRIDFEWGNGTGGASAGRLRVWASQYDDRVPRSSQRTQLFDADLEGQSTLRVEAMRFGLPYPNHLAIGSSGHFLLDRIWLTTDE